MSTKIQVKRDTSNRADEVQPEEKTRPDISKQEKKTKSESVNVLKTRLKKCASDIKKLESELAGLKEDYLRQLADKENLRKRLEREKTEFFQRSLSDVFLDVLTIVDNFERALKSDVQESDQSLRDGVDLIYRQILSFLERWGVSPIDVSDKTFDPRFHQAFATAQSADVQEAQIEEEYQKGYTLHGRLLRPVLVKVIVPAKEEN